MDASQTNLRAIPSVDRVLRELADVTDVPRPALAAVVRREVERVRTERAANPSANGDVIGRVRSAVDNMRRSRLQPLINATGVIIHTNFGRAPMGSLVAQTLSEIATNYNNLEYDLVGGARGGRAAYLEHNLAVLCGAEAATVVNNCAAALLLVLHHFANAPPKTRVIVSRGELVQIGGGFRIPEILEAGGAALHEVGTTNQTTLADYRDAIDPAHTAMILKVHQSNFHIEGFTDSVAIEQLAPLARESGIPLIADIGSGATFDTATLGAHEHEPTIAEAIAAGADLVTFSGDKLLGGPQAGIIAGRAGLVAKVKKDPLFRALRCDKLILSALQVTVDLLLSSRTREIPIRAMMDVPDEDLRRRAEAVVARLKSRGIDARVADGVSRVGGGSLPRTTMPSVTIELADPKLADVLRRGVPPVIGYVADDTFKLDLRTVFPSQDEQLFAAIRAAHGQRSMA